MIPNRLNCWSVLFHSTSSDFFFKNIITNYPKNESYRKTAYFQIKSRWFSFVFSKKCVWISLNLCQATHQKLQISSLSLYTCNYTRPSWIGHFPSYILLGINTSYRVMWKHGELNRKEDLHKHHRKTTEVPTENMHHYWESQPRLHLTQTASLVLHRSQLWRFPCPPP